MSAWKDITTDAKTGHVVAKDYFKAWAFFAGVGYLVGIVPAAAILFKEHLDASPGGLLLGLAFGVQALKEGANYFNRKTADDNGNALAQPGTTDPPDKPALMPQADAPNP